MWLGTECTYNQPLVLPKSLRRLIIFAGTYNAPLHLPEKLQELEFQCDCKFNQPLVLPDKLRVLSLGDGFNLPLALPSTLIELRLGSAYSHHLVLPQLLKLLSFRGKSQFKLPRALPPSLRCIRFSDSFNEPTIIPSGVEDLTVGQGFTHDLSLPNSLQKLEWRCNRPISIPDGVSEVRLGSAFHQPVVFPSRLKKVTFYGSTYSHPIEFPPDLEELMWYPRDGDGLVLPEGLQKLTWASDFNVRLPVGLKDLAIWGRAPLALPEGLLKITIDHSAHQYRLPESVQEVFSSNPSNFTHSTTLHHLKLGYSFAEVDLSDHRIHKLTICCRWTRIKHWPQGLEELAFVADDMHYPLHVPRGCRLVGEKRPTNLIME